MKLFFLDIIIEMSIIIKIYILFNEKARKMRKPFERDIKKEILGKCFGYLVEKGLENASVKNMCEETGISSGSIYYWFKDKDEAVLDSAEYGLTVVTNKLFDYVFSHIDDVGNVLKTFPEKLMEYKKELRFIYQVTTSNQYGERMRMIADRLDSVYVAYSEKLSKSLNYDSKKLLPIVYLFISATLDYVVWEDEAKMEHELKAIYSFLDILLI